MLNRVELIGRLGHDAELKYTKTGIPVLSVQIATSERFKDKDGKDVEKTTWHSLRGFGKRFEAVKNYLVKGLLIYVEGKIQYESYEDKKGNRQHSVFILINDFKFLGGGQKSTSKTEDSTVTIPIVTRESDLNQDIFSDNELPF